MHIHRPLIFLLLVATFAGAQDRQTRASELDQMRRQLQETQSQLNASMKLIDALRHDVDDLRSRLVPLATDVSVANIAPVVGEGENAAASIPTVEDADKDPSFLSAKIKELHQVKVESGSKYSVKFSGMVLFNAYHNTGNVDIVDLPNLAFGQAPNTPNGNVGATLRQTVMRVDVTGPTLWGARTSGDVSFDFYGGAAATQYGVTAGIMRMRTANLQLDWDHTTVRIGQDTPFISPLSPTSYATVAEPGLSWAGNLWVWTPQVVVEHRIITGENTSFVLQGGILDPLTEEIPYTQFRSTTAGEASGVPAFAGRIALDHSSSPRLPFTIGFGAYQSRHRYELLKPYNSWTANADFMFAPAKQVEFTGEWYYGQGAGGLGGGIWTSAVFNAAASPTAVLPLHSTGGWGQIKLKPISRFEINAAMGQDENRGNDLRFFPVGWTSGGYPALQKNRAQMVNFVVKPNSVLLFGVEYRHLFTAPSLGKSATGEHVNFFAGIRF
jgi:hypothetical protein